MPTAARGRNPRGGTPPAPPKKFKPPVDPAKRNPAQRFGTAGSLFRLKNQDKPKAAKPAYTPQPYAGGSLGTPSATTPVPLLPLDTGGGGGGGGGEPTAPTAPTPPPTPPVPPTFYSRTQDSPYLQLPEQFLAYLNPGQRTQLNTWLQQAGFRGVGQVGMYGETSYLIPPMSPAGGGNTPGGGVPAPGPGGPGPGPNTPPVPPQPPNIDLTTIMDPALRQWMAFFMGSMGYGRGITGPISAQAGGIPNFPTLPGPTPGTPPTVPPAPPQSPIPPPGTGGYYPAPGV